MRLMTAVDSLVVAIEHNAVSSSATRLQARAYIGTSFSEVTLRVRQ